VSPMTQLQPPCHGVPRVREEPYSNVLLRSLGKRLLPNDHLSWRIYADGPPSCSLQSSVPLRSPLFGFGLGPLEIDAQEVDDPEQQSEERNRSQYLSSSRTVVIHLEPSLPSNSSTTIRLNSFLMYFGGP